MDHDVNQGDTPPQNTANTSIVDTDTVRRVAAEVVTEELDKRDFVRLVDLDALRKEVFDLVNTATANFNEAKNSFMELARANQAQITVVNERQKQFIQEQRHFMDSLRQSTENRTKRVDKNQEDIADMREDISNLSTQLARFEPLIRQSHDAVMAFPNDMREMSREFDRKLFSLDENGRPSLMRLLTNAEQKWEQWRVEFSDELIAFRNQIGVDLNTMGEAVDRNTEYRERWSKISDTVANSVGKVRQLASKQDRKIVWLIRIGAGLAGILLGEGAASDWFGLINLF